MVAQAGLCHRVGEYLRLDDKVALIVAVGRGGGDAADSAVGATFDTLFPAADRDPTAGSRARMLAMERSITNSHWQCGQLGVHCR